ncbi:putative long-chain-alcohol O-fatty-acyltransferase [Dioscorea sansibarensis]
MADFPVPDGELQKLMKLSLTLIACMSYARFISSKTPPGYLRLTLLLPILSLLPLLPFSFSSVHLRGISAFFLSWLAIFKLLLLSFSLPPLHPSLPLPIFIAIASLPVKLRSSTSISSTTPLSLFSSISKLLLLLLLLSLYPYKHLFPSYLLLALYCFHIYLALELVLSSARFLAATLLGLDLEPQFNAPYFSTSLRDFWGHRWNLMVTIILRPSVYHPVRSRFGTAAGVLAVFFVSGVMHEVMFYYLTLSSPTGEVTCFFILHGICTVVEGLLARRWKWGGVHPAVAPPLVLGFVAVTGFWLFFPPLLRTGTDEKTVEECAAIVAFLEKGGRALVYRIGLLFHRV